MMDRAALSTRCAYAGHRHGYSRQRPSPRHHACGCLRAAARPARERRVLEGRLHGTARGGLSRGRSGCGDPLWPGCRLHGASLRSHGTRVVRLRPVKVGPCAVPGRPQVCRPCLTRLTQALAFSPAAHSAAGPAASVGRSGPSAAAARWPAWHRPDDSERKRARQGCPPRAASRHGRIVRRQRAWLTRYCIYVQYHGSAIMVHGR